MSETFPELELPSWVPSLALVRAEWYDAPADDYQLTWRLVVAQDALSDYAPVLAEGQPVPPRYTQAVILHAREVSQAVTRSGDLIGFDTYAVRARDLTPTVKALLRPRRAVPVVG